MEEKAQSLELDRGLIIFLRNLVQDKFPQANNDEDEIGKLCTWLCHTPEFTTFRVNTLMSTPEKVMKLILLECNNIGLDNESVVIEKNDDITEMVTIRANDKRRIELLPQPEAKHIIVDVICAAALLRGAHLFAPGVLAMPSRIKLHQTVNIYADIDRKCLRGFNKMYNGTKKFIGVGTVKMQRHQLFGVKLKPSGVAVQMVSVVSGVPCLGNSFLPEGVALLQNAPSIVCGRVLNPQPGETILDICASPGNKTTHLAQLMNDKGTIVAIDRTKSKIKLIQQSCQALSIKSVFAFAYDSVKLVAPIDQIDQIAKTSILSGPPFTAESFDRILIDAPCSGLGQRPQFRKANISFKTLSSYVAMQRKLFQNAIQLLKPGGHLVYSTCTVTTGENERMVSWALKKFPELILIPAEPIMGGPGLRNYGLDDITRYYVQRFGPSDNQTTKNPVFSDSIGFFIALFCKDS